MTTTKETTILVSSANALVNIPSCLIHTNWAGLSTTAEFHNLIENLLFNCSIIKAIPAFPWNNELTWAETKHSCLEIGVSETLTLCPFQLSLQHCKAMLTTQGITPLKLSLEVLLCPLVSIRIFSCKKCRGVFYILSFRYSADTVSPFMAKHINIEKISPTNTEQIIVLQ